MTRKDVAKQVRYIAAIIEAPDSDFQIDGGAVTILYQIDNILYQVQVRNTMSGEFEK